MMTDGDPGDEDQVRPAPALATLQADEFRAWRAVMRAKRYRVPDSTLARLRAEHREAKVALRAACRAEEAARAREGRRPMAELGRGER